MSRLYTLLLFVLLLAPLNAAAQEPAATTAAAATPSTAAPSSALGPGDTLLVTIPHPDGLKSIEITLDERGEVVLGMYGRLKLGALELEPAQQRLREHLGAWLVNTQGVSLAMQSRAILVFVSGHVSTPGTIRLKLGEEPWHAIQRAGSVLPGADTTRVSLWRGGQESVLDLSLYLQGRQAADTIALRAGDVIFVPARAGVMDVRTGQVELLNQAALNDHVFVLGAIKQPGMYRRAPGSTAWLVLAQAAGPKEDADLGNARWITATTSEAVDLSAQTQGAALSWPKQGAAILYVPPRAHSSHHQAVGKGIIILGAVNQQGRHPVSGPVTLPEALALASGASDRGDLSRVTVTEQGDGFTLSATYDLEDALKRGGAALQVRVKPGQSVFVESSDKTTWKSVARTISDIAILAAAFSVFVAL